MVQKGYHCAYDIHYHIVFPVKYRKALLDKDIEHKIKTISREIQERYEITMESIGLDLNHIHLLCSAHPKYSIGVIVQRYKSITARELFKSFPHLKQDLWGGEFWSDGYYVATIGEKGNKQIVERYIRNQGHNPEDVQLRLLS